MFTLQNVNSKIFQYKALFNLQNVNQIKCAQKSDTKKFLILCIHSMLTDQNVNYTDVNLNDCKRRWRRSNSLKGFPFDETLGNFFFNNGNLWLLDFCFWFWLFDFKILILSFEINFMLQKQKFFVWLILICLNLKLN